MNDLILPLWAELLAAALLAVGGLFTLVGAIGLLRLPDFYMRLHAPTKATTLGVGGVLLASLLLAWLDRRPGLTELLISLFLFLGAPVSANLMAMAALHRQVPSYAPKPPEPARE